jgi:uncharacterized protein involved in exopolysaccharide biosynthesis
MNNSINQSDELISFLWNKRKPLIIISVLTFIIASISSLMIKDEYLSTVILYPAITSSVSFNEFDSEQQKISRFGSDLEVEQMLQVLESNIIRNRMISKYNLINHYKIDTNYKYFKTQLFDEYAERITYERNKNGAVLISVFDENPDTAAFIANDIASLYDSTRNSMIQERAINDLKIKSIKYQKMKNEMQDIIDTMSILSAMGVVTNDGYRALTEGFVNSKDINTKKEFKSKIKISEEYGSLLKSFQVKSTHLSSRLAAMQILYEQAESNANSYISHKFLVETAFPADKKKYPNRTLIVLSSVFSTLLLSMIGFLLKEKFSS